jgi:hypothetical protein
MPPCILEMSYNHYTQICRSTCPIPVLLQVNQETRELALRHYELVLGTNGRDPSIHFDLDVDTMYSGAGNITDNETAEFVGKISTNDSERIRYLAIDSHLNLHRLLPYYQDPDSETETNNVS